MTTTTEKKYSREFLLNLLTKMVTIRRFEETAAQMYGLQKIGGFCHLYIGQEASGVGAVESIDLRKDYVFAAYRDHGLAIACGMDINVLMAELFGKATGCSRGKGGSMHFFDVAKHFMGGNGIVGAHIPLAAGVGLAVRNSGTNGVVLCFFGDGAIHQGTFHESLNMAKIWSLPVLYICENNQYGMGTDFRRVSAVEDFTIMGQSYGIQGKQVNGMDVLTVYETVTGEIERIRREHSPGFLEIKTYRYKGHSMSDPAKYRTREELDSYKLQDPVQILKKQMLQLGVLTEKEYLELDRFVKERCEDAVKFADESPEPSEEVLYQDVFA